MTYENEHRLHNLTKSVTRLRCFNLHVVFIVVMNMLNKSNDFYGGS